MKRWPRLEEKTGLQIVIFLNQACITRAVRIKDELMSTDDVTSPLHSACEGRFRDHPETAHVTLHAHGFVGADGMCKVESGKPRTEVGVHPVLGGDGKSACAGDMLLEALVGCAGVTLGQMATAM